MTTRVEVEGQDVGESEHGLDLAACRITPGDGAPRSNNVVADHAKGVAFAPPQALQDAWNRCQELRSQPLSPATYTPHLWRTYQDALVRYEQLLRAGDRTGKAGSVKKRVDDLETRILDAQRLKQMASRGNTLPMPAVTACGE